MQNQVTAAGADATTNPSTETKPEWDIVSFIGSIAKFFKPGDRLQQINSIRGGAKPDCCFGMQEYYDASPYAQALSRDYPCLSHALRGDWCEEFLEELSDLLHTGIRRGSGPMVVSALLAAGDHTADICSELSEMERQKILFLLNFSQADPEFRAIFKREQSLGTIN